MRRKPLTVNREASTWTWIFQRGDWIVRTESRTLVSSTQSDFLVHVTMDAYEGARRVFLRNYEDAIARNGD